MKEILKTIKYFDFIMVPFVFYKNYNGEADVGPIDNSIQLLQIWSGNESDKIDEFNKKYDLFAKEAKKIIEANKLDGGSYKKRATNKKIQWLKNYKTKRLNGKKH
jgi:hypothetical protein